MKRLRGVFASVACALGLGYAQSASDFDSIIWHKPKARKSKPNRISQSKRRKYKRQGRE